jgi:hypothetical protein
MFLVLIFTKGWVEPRATVWSEGNMALKNPLTPLGIDPGAVLLVAQCLNHYATPGPYIKSCTSGKLPNRFKLPFSPKQMPSVFWGGGEIYISIWHFDRSTGVTCHKPNNVLYADMQNGRVWTGLIKFRIRTSGQLMWTQQLTTGFHTIPGIPSLADVLPLQTQFCAKRSVTRFMCGLKVKTAELISLF